MVLPRTVLNSNGMGMVTSLFAHKMAAAAGPTVDRAALLRTAGIDAAAPPDPAFMISDERYYDMIEAIAVQIDATDLPLRTGASMRCDDYGALGLAWKAAPDLIGSFSRVARFARLWTSVVEYHYKTDGDLTVYTLEREGPARLGLHLSNEASLASGVALAREVSTQPFAPVEVHFQHQAPNSTQAHETYFGCPVRFNAGQNALIMSTAALSVPNRLGDEGITCFLLTHLEAALSQVPDDTLKSRTKEAIARALSDGLPKMTDIALGLGLSARSFHRRLSDHGLTFQSLTDETRRELAEGLLRDDTYSLADIAFLSGFSDQSAFTRAFKRWVGMPPAQYRKNAQGS